MKPYSHPSWIEIDLGQFKKNISIVKQYVAPSLYCLLVKANAYGHGLCGMAKAAEEAGVDYLGVAHLQEGMKLREAGIQIPILVFGAIHEDQISALLEYNLEFTVSSKLKAEFVEKAAQTLQKSCRVHLEVETGMQRTGMRPETALALLEELSDSEKIEVVGVYSHLAKMDDVGRSQVECFEKFLRQIEKPLIAHISNSGGIVSFPDMHLQMVRPAFTTFGYLTPEGEEVLKGVKSCFSLKSKIAYFKVVEEGSGISYGHTYVTNKRTRIVTIPVGFGDGYRRALSNRGSVLIRGKRYPIVGAICMDQFMVDIGDDEAYVGDEVVLIGKQGNEEIAVQEIASLCDTIPYEVLCLFNERLPRIYLE